MESICLVHLCFHICEGILLEPEAWQTDRCHQSFLVVSRSLAWASLKRLGSKARQEHSCADVQASIEGCVSGKSERLQRVAMGMVF
eukprot:3719140-Amphidinium_carterae.1